MTVFLKSGDGFKYDAEEQNISIPVPSQSQNIYLLRKHGYLEPRPVPQYQPHPGGRL